MKSDLVLGYPGTPVRSRVRIGAGSLATLGAFTASTTGAARVVIVTDTHVGPLYERAATRSLRAAGIGATVVRVRAGERAKSAAQLARLWDAFAATKLARADAVVALGGGVVGDLAGFAAATWLRGVAWVCVPTTVLAQVDSSIGGKTAIDVPAGKNLVGAFHQPAGVLVDPATLATLSARHVRVGLAEVVKKGFAVDAKLFAWVERHLDALADGESEALTGAVERAVRVKAAVVKADEREREGGGRTALNFGHTLGHAIEAALGYRGLLHGEAVAIGMRAAAELSQHAAGLPAESRIRLEAALDHLRLPVTMPRTPLRALLAAMTNDKKSANGKTRWVLTPQIGVASVPRAIDHSLVRAALLHAGARG
ncbi:MAG: 3-dehydroquinate synthase [Candidatus Eisenbacteria bacterium]|uniref:3-dehydroquinate synthase n=1 Tax=Eiseniibacteriota bacterium TaxID=2212470 RepID=A0A933SE18_UNCEI|nr:3-dehydroquinate synthase [Candidatus Eisenbacteria bacterium]